MGKTEFFSLSKATNQGEVKLQIQTSYTLLKIDFVLHPAQGRGDG